MPPADASPARPGRLAGRVALITGAGSGIGRAAALRFGAEGAGVVVADVDGAAADATATTVTRAGGRAVAVAGDVAAPGAMDDAVRAGREAFGPVDALYANAGIEGAGTAHETTVEHWERVMAVNLRGVWLSIRAVVPAMLDAGGGAIVTQASTAGLVGVAGLAPYSAAKGGVIALTRQVAVEYGRHGIRANAICPGTVWTPLVDRTYEGRGGDAAFGSREAMAASAARAYPLGRLGTVEEVAAFALFLASDEAAWITGGVFAADGGYTAR